MRILRSQHGLPQGVQWYGCDFWIPKKYVKIKGIEQESRAPIDRSVGSETFRPFRKSWQTDHTTDGQTRLQGSFASIRENHVLFLNKKGHIWLKEWRSDLKSEGVLESETSVKKKQVEDLTSGPLLSKVARYCFSSGYLLTDAAYPEICHHILVNQALHQFIKL